MIFFWIVKAIVAFFAAVFFWLPNATELPFGVDEYVVLGVGYFRAMADFFPPLYTVLAAFLIYFTFKITMMSLKLIRVIR